MPNRIAMKVPPQMLELAEQMAGSSDGLDLFDELPYMVYTFVSATESKLEIKIEIMSEENMFAEYKDDPELQILN